MKQILTCLLISFFAVLCSCAHTPQVMSYFPGKLAVQSDRVWPGVPEVPRYRFEGLLIGEDNFRPQDGYRPGVGKQVLRWLVGLGPDSRARRRVMDRPQAGMVGEDGRIYITDIGRRAVFVFDETNGEMQIWEQAGQGNFISPIGIAPGYSGDILVADSGLGHIVRLDRDGNYLGALGGDVLERPTGLARDPQSNLLYVADTAQNLVKVLDDQGVVSQVIGGPGKEPGEFNGPTHLSFRNGKLYVSDTLNARIQILTMTPGQGFSQVDVIGQRGLYVGNLTRPKGVAVDNDDNVYVVESYYDHLLVFNQDGQYLMPIGGSGNNIGEFFLPAGAWTDTRGRVFIADMFNSRVIVLQYLGA